MGAFEVLLDLLAVHPLLPGGSPLTVRRTSRGWMPFTRTEAVAALRLMIGSSGRHPAQYALHSGRLEGQRSWRRKACQSFKSSAQAGGSIAFS